jgi:hypothetical protein
MHCRTNESAVGIKASVARQPVLYKVIAFPEMLHAVKNIFTKMFYLLFLRRRSRAKGLVEIL